jgi:sigma-B regulation protein RsbU (phosphoserine phosphatase)
MPGFPLGIAPAIAYVALEITLDHGDTLVFYTDGVVEAHNPARQMFGFERLERMVRDHGQIAPAELVELVLRAVSDFMGTAPQHDDMTVMVVRIT